MTTEKKVSKVEVIKAESNHLRGSISEALEDGQTFFEEDNLQLLKFHGTYQQDDRDLRAKLKKEGREKHYMMMIRARIPGGVMTPEAYLQFDKLADSYGNQTMRITTRQTFQLHGILKHDLKSTIQGINQVLITTLGGCGDQVRNTVTCPSPTIDRFHTEMREDILEVVSQFGAKTNAYHEIWLDGEKVEWESPENEEPLYKDVYLPRKFKIAVAPEGDNCVDVYGNDLGLVAHPSAEGGVEGYTMLVGGGMGRTATLKDTYARLATPVAYVPRDELLSASLEIVKIQRDHGDRHDRKHSRFKYLLDEKGMDWFAGELSARLGHELIPPRDLVWTNAKDHLGWHGHGNNKYYLGLFIQNGRIQDTETSKLKTVLREIVETYRPTVRMTTQQNLLFADLNEADRAAIETKLRAAGVALIEEISPTLEHSMACPALPTCGLATAESERFLPTVIKEFEGLLGELGLSEEAITIRMTGCSNGCARPYISEIGFVGRTPGKYDLFLGADFFGARMNTIYRESVPSSEFLNILRPILTAFRDERQNEERFGDFCHRVGFDYLQSVETAGALA